MSYGQIVVRRSKNHSEVIKKYYFTAIVVLHQPKTYARLYYQMRAIF
jgi:hypothetical protein